MFNIKNLINNLKLVGQHEVKIRENQIRLDNIEQMLAAKHKEYDEKVLECQIRLDNIEQFARQMRIDLDKVVDALLSTNNGGDSSYEELKFNMLNKKTYSQSGEDAIVAYVLANLQIPFNKASYLDLGANFPIEGSNSYFLYKQGARGVLVEANPGLIADLEKNRTEDKVLNRCIALTSGEQIEFHVMSDAGLSTPDMEQVKEVQSINPEVQLLYSKAVETISVNDLFENYFNEVPLVCSIDIEGKDYEILDSISMEKYRPLLYIVETIEYSTKLQVNAKRNDIVELMKKNGYEEYAFTGVNSIFIDKNQIK